MRVTGCSDRYIRVPTKKREKKIVERDIIIDFEKKEMMKHGDFLKSHVKGEVLWWFSIVDMSRMR